MIGTVAGVARSFEITNCDGSRPCASIASSSAGSLRMNSAENPPTVDCSVMDTVGLARTFCLSWSSRKAGRFKRPLVAWLVTPPSPRYSFRNRRAGGWGIRNVRIIDLAGRIRPLTAVPAPRLARVSSHLALAVHLAACRIGNAEQTVPGKEQLLSVLGGISRAARQRSRRAKSLARAAGASFRGAQGRRRCALSLCRAPALRLHLRRHPAGL